MTMLTKISRIYINGILLFVFTICFINSALAQSAFYRNDNFDFRGLHHLSAGGSNPDNFNIFIESDSDFRKFKLYVKSARLQLSIWSAIRVRVDMNNDGIWEQNWTPYQFDEITVNYVYPNPSGISANHTIKIEIDYYNYGSGSVYRTKYKQITVFSTPRVFVDSDNNSFIQLRDEDAISKIPVLMIEGFDPLNESFQELYYNLTWNLINTDLYPNGYEVFILNFNQGGRDLRLNADVVLKAIEKVHEVCPNYKIALAGLSMGGPIGRYALANKENEGLTHDVGLFLSYDAPQIAANISPGLQDWIKEQDPGEEAIYLLQENLKSTAAKQMLGYNTYDPDHVLHNEFYNELEALNGDGYPHQSYNASVSNGNLQATHGYASVGRHLMTLKINDQIIHTEIAQQRDCGTGSKTTDITMRRYGDIFNNPFLHVWYELEFLFNPVYHPTWSALDLVNFDINEITGDITSFERSKFDDFVVQTNALHHHELSLLTRSTIMDWLNQDFNITINYSLPEGGSLSSDNYQVNILHPITINIQPKTVNVNGDIVSYTFLKWEDGSTENPRTFYTSHDVSSTVIMKGTQISDNQNAYKYNNQRKFIRTPNGTFHSTYHSMNAIWYETSTDNGQTWQLKDYSIPTETTWIESEPSISYYVNSSNQTIVIIAWRLQRGSLEDLIKMKVYVYDPVNGLIDTDEQDVCTDDPELLTVEKTSPVVTCAPDGKTLIVWENKINGVQSSLKYSYGERLSNGTWQWWQTSKWLECTSSGALSPALYASNIDYWLKFHLTWAQNNKIYYCCIYPNLDNELEYDLQNIEVSERSGYTTHSHPTITGTDWIIPGRIWQEYIRIAWIGYRESIPDEIPPEGSGATPIGESRVLLKFKAPTYWFSLSVWGSNVGSVNINKGNTAIDHYQPAGIAWSEWNGSSIFNKYIRTHDVYPTPIRTLTTTGQEIQVNNSNDFFDMYVSSFHRSTQPYFSNISESLSGGLNKIESLPIFRGREGIVSKANTDFYYAIGDITLDGANVDFISVPDSLAIIDEQIMNEYLNSVAFNVNNNLVLTYGVQYGIIDSLAATIALSDGSEINFKVEMVDYQTGEVLGVFDEVSYTAGNVFQYNNIGYQVDLSGVGSRTVFLRLSVNTTSECEYAISNRYSDTEVLNKNGYKQISYKENMVVKEYALEQNYPNPFNPATTIKYQIPKSGNVTLKIYDILGNEVSTLVKEHQNEGKYEVNFDATSLASGVYIYRLSVNDYINVKKMVLVK